MGTEYSTQSSTLQSDAHAETQSSEGTMDRAPLPSIHTPYYKTDFTESPDLPKIPCVFKWSLPAKEVFVAGNFCDWGRIPLSRSTQDFSTIVELPEGIHEYKFFVDGAWRQDPDVATVADPYGGLNNLIEVKSPSSQLLADLSLSRSVGGCSRPDSPEGSYGQDVPNIPVRLGPHAPPEFPKQLTQMPLLHFNPSGDCPDQTAISSPEDPSHVCLRHLYAISLKDCTILASPQRYRDKFYTTLLYKPL